MLWPSRDSQQQEEPVQYDMPQAHYPQSDSEQLAEIDPERATFLKECRETDKVVDRMIRLFF